jgi:sulfite oxidase
MPGAPKTPWSPLTRARVGRRPLLRGGALAGAAALIGGTLPSTGQATAMPPAASPALLAQGEEPARRVHTTSPLVAEAPLWAQEGTITPNDWFFIRDHFPPAPLPPESWRLEVGGLVLRPQTLTFDHLRQLPARRVVAMLECAGNTRGRFEPPAEGTRWGNGGASTAEWVGVPLGTVLDFVGLDSGALEVVVQGGDNPQFARSLPLDKAYDADTILAWAMNGQPLPDAHGAPVRLVVPGWIGVASVKWVRGLRVVEAPFEGYYHRQRYIYEYADRDEIRPAVWIPLKSVITRPRAGAVLGIGPQVIQGFAWSGQGRIVRVEVSDDDQATWRDARLVEPTDRWAWTMWEYTWNPRAPGDYRLWTRATDDAGNVQPLSVEWNRFGYGYNAIQDAAYTVR